MRRRPPRRTGRPTLQAAARQRTAEAKGAEVAMIPYVPAETDENTPRAQHPNAKNRKLFTKSISTRSGTPPACTPGRSPTKLVIVEGGTHMDFYDVPKYVDRAVAEATPFFQDNLTGQTADQD